MQDSQLTAPYAPHKPRFLLTLLCAWLVSGAICVWFSGAFNSETLAGAVAYGLSYTAVPMVIGFFVLRKAQNPRSLRNRSIFVALMLTALIAKGIYEDNADLRASVRNQCEASVSENNQAASNAYCDCFTDGATSIIQSASRRALFAQVPSYPMQDESYVQAMQEMANLCLNKIN